MSGEELMASSCHLLSCVLSYNITVCWWHTALCFIKSFAGLPATLFCDECYRLHFTCDTFEETSLLSKYVNVMSQDVGKTDPVFRTS